MSSILEPYRELLLRTQEHERVRNWSRKQTLHNLVAKACLAALFTGYALGAAAESLAPVDGTVLTPENQALHDVLAYVLEGGCMASGHHLVEIQYPATLKGYAARGARMTVADERNQIFELFIHQKKMGKGVLVSSLCLEPSWISRVRLAFIYGGAGTDANLLVDDFSQWPVEQ